VKPDPADVVRGAESKVTERVSFGAKLAAVSVTVPLAVAVAELEVSVAGGGAA
jgi:hypothetical protein